MIMMVSTSYWRFRFHETKDLNEELGIAGYGSFGEYGGEEFDFKEEVGGKEGYAGKEEE